MIKFHIPDFFYHYDLNTCLIRYMNSNPDAFRKDICIGSIYGTFPDAYWNGGRFMGGYADVFNIENTINAINNLGIPVRFTWTNSLINEHLLYDPYCNTVMKFANNGMNEVLVNSPLLEDYLRKTYPNFKYISSTTKCLLDIDRINKECEDYYLVVLDYRKNIDKDFLGKLKYKDKIELLINAYCSPECKERSEHYEYLSRLQLTEKLEERQCYLLAKTFHESFKYNTVIRVDDLYDYYVNQGFENFKIEGRTVHPIDLIDSYMYYMVKEEYQDEIRNNMVQELWRWSR